MIGGLLLIAAGLCLVGYNLWDAYRAADSVEKIVVGLEKQTDEETPTSDHAAVFDQPEQETPACLLNPEQETPAYLLNPEMEMPTIELKGNEYIGILEIPSLGLSLPVMSGWSYPKLKLAPCRYTGSVYLNDLIIAAHNYPSHFGTLINLEQGDSVIFTDVESNQFPYTVSGIEQLPSTALEEMQSGDWDLTLFTCTVGGKARVAVRCQAVD